MAYVSCRCVSNPRPANQACSSSTPSEPWPLRIQSAGRVLHDRSRPWPRDPRSVLIMIGAHPSDIMTSEQVAAFLLFAVAAAGTPGPSNVLLTATGAQVGVPRGVPCLLGVTVGMGVMMFAVAFGLGSVVVLTPAAL